jgi:hypothetical protein
MKISYKPLSAKTWNDFIQLFGTRGACGGCWCMVWRLKPSQFEKQKGLKNKNAMRKLVSLNKQVGIIGFKGKSPIGWCAIAPRENFVRLENSQVLKKIDEQQVWSITCFFIAKEFRRLGLSTELLKCAIDFCRKKKVKIVEGYPAVPYASSIPDAFAWTGIPSSFEKAGFVEAARRSKSRPIMRYYITKQ